MRSPILLLIFNRPDTTERVFKEIRKAQPPRLYIAADGPRLNKDGEKELCDKTRLIATKVDWNCEVRTLFREKNLGCGVAVCNAISWFFEYEEEGIILEDDILAHQDFFAFCDELLEKYRYNSQIWTIGGHNLFYDGINRNYSYGFMSIAHIWGWATWKRAWRNFSYDLSHFNYKDFQRNLITSFPDKRERKFWEKIFEEVKHGKQDIWDYQWTISSIMNRGLCIVPYRNLTENIGFGKNATHTSGGHSKELNRATESIMPLKHPISITLDLEAEDIEKENAVMYISNWRKIKGFLKRIIKR